jgi:phosphopantetheinyl transferase (holo-ACP synthase)
MPNTANCEKSCADFFAPKEVQQKAWRSQAKTWPQKSFGFMALKYVANTVAKSQFAVCINFTSNNVLKPEVWFLLVSLHGYQPRSCVLLNELCSQVGSQGFS